jgi:DNA repair exonuclease SbcCD ATPase subunit
MPRQKKTTDLQSPAASIAQPVTAVEAAALDRLQRENQLLLGEIFVARRAAEITAELVVEQITRMEENYHALAKANHELRQALEEINTLRSTLPICAQCKSIRDDAGYWNRIEKYLEQHSALEFTHGLCPDCEATLYSKESWYQSKKNGRQE